MDTASFTVHENVTVSKLSVAFVFPHSVLMPRVDVADGSPSVKPIATVDADSRTVITFDYEYPVAGTYEWRLSMAGAE